MGQSYSLDLRARSVGHVRAGHSRRDAARHFRVSASCAVKLLRRADRTGSVESAHRGRPRGSGKLAADHVLSWQLHGQTKEDEARRRRLNIVRLEEKHGLRPRSWF